MGGPRALKLKLTILVTDDWGLMFESPKTGNSQIPTLPLDEKSCVPIGMNSKNTKLGKLA
jgi:hypothetical protein